MRITGGQYRGRLLQAPEGRDVRPTSDKVRQAIFNILNARGLVQDSVVLDVFCGTGALGLEALSWGALCCTFIDKNRSSLDVCRDNYAALKIPAKFSYHLKDAAALGQRPENEPAANLAFLDPPYNQNLIAPALAGLSAGGWLSAHAHVLIETEKGFKELLPAFETLMERDYGDTRIALLRRSG